MAANFSRSMNKDLQAGVKDGTLKSYTPDRGGEVEVDHAFERADDLQPQYGMSILGHPVGCMCQYC